MIRVSILGLGPGNPDLLTLAARQVLERADLVIGATRLLQDLPEGKPQRKLVFATRACEIVACLQECAAPVGSHDAIADVAIVMSGDVGLFSGAKSLLELLGAEEGAFEVEQIPGISSVQYFAARLKRPWQSWRCVSAHGVACDPAAELSANHEVFFVTGGNNTVGSLCQVLTEAGFGDGAVTVGERLSYPDEALRSGAIRDFAGQDFDDLSVMLVERDGMPVCAGHANADDCGACALPWPWAQGGIPDDCFKRTGVPMTKQEVRAVLLAKLKVAATDIVYDIGSGSGSVSVEMALLAKRGRVYAVEHAPDAVALTQKNCARFALNNVQVVEGFAPEAFAGLPAPDAAFIGGSGGRLEQIVATLIEKNPAVRVCVACVTMETLIEANRLLSGSGFEGFEVCCVNVARSEALGSSTMLKAQNPIFLISATGSGA